MSSAIELITIAVMYCQHIAIHEKQSTVGAFASLSSLSTLPSVAGQVLEFVYQVQVHPVIDFLRCACPVVA
ncbi:MAG: hypothetical protein KJ638_05600 [Chloroflexi bacterium]|nr:hypothetical protein [Chloroflexota bacterium]